MAAQRILLLHGALGSASQFDSLVESLCSDFEILTMNLAVHGGRAFPEENFSFPLFVSDIIALLDEKGIDRISVFGYSMGGYAALWLARDHANRIDRIFTLATKMNWSEETAGREAAMLVPEKVEEKVPAFAKMLEERHRPQDWKVVMRKTADMMIELGKNHLNANDFRSVKHRTMIGIGDKDNMVSLSESENVSVLLPHGTLKIFNDTPHPFEKVDLDKRVWELKIFFN